MKAPRSPLLKSGKILIGSWQIPCTVRNLSRIGGCFEVQTTTGIPAVFQFVLPNQTPKICKVMWRDHTKLGVYFRADAPVGYATADAEYTTLPSRDLVSV
jgi:hypothetical protein